MKRLALTAACLGLVLCFASSSPASNIETYATPAGASVVDGPVSAQAVFSISAGSITVDLTDLLANPTSAGQCVNGVTFTLSTGQTNLTLVSSSATERTISGDGTFSDAASLVATGWGVSASGGSVVLSGMGVQPTWPEHLLIGPPDSAGAYEDANGSLAGNKPHNPFLAGTAEFTLSAPGLPASATITGATFTFSTSSGAAEAQVGVPVPEPMTLALLSAGGFVTLVRRRQTR